MLPSRIAALRDRSTAIVDRLMAEPVRLSFFKAGEPDPTRPVTNIDAVLRVGSGDDTNMSGGFSQSWRTRIAAGHAELHINLAEYRGPPIKKGDAVRALARPGQPWFEVLRVDDRGDARLVLALGEK